MTAAAATANGQIATAHDTANTTKAKASEGNGSVLPLKRKAAHVNESSVRAANGVGLVVVVDFGSQYTQLIARRARELGVQSVILNGGGAGEKAEEELRGILAERENDGGTCVVLSGGPNSVHAEGSPGMDGAVLRVLEEANVPVLGICYGMQLLVSKNGGDVVPGGAYKHTDVRLAFAQSILVSPCVCTRERERERERENTLVVSPRTARAHRRLLTHPLPLLTHHLPPTRTSTRAMCVYTYTDAFHHHHHHNNNNNNNNYRQSARSTAAWISVQPSSVCRAYTKARTSASRMETCRAFG